MTHTFQYQDKNSWELKYLDTLVKRILASLPWNDGELIEDTHYCLSYLPDIFAFQLHQY